MNLNQILKVNDSERNQQWETQLFHSLSTSFVELINDQPVNGPDSWPYLLLRSDDNLKPELAEPFSDLVRWASTRGIGMVLNPQKEYPDYVFTYGMLWYFKEKGLFYGAPVNTENLEKRKIINSGDASNDYLPDYVRLILKDFFKRQGLEQVKILVVHFDDGSADLVFSNQSLKNPPVHEHKGILEAISWFLPPHYSLVMGSEEESIQFYNL